MEEKKEARKQDSNGHGWVPSLLENVFGTIRSFVEGTVGVVQMAVQEVTGGLMKRLFFFLSIICGAYFLLTGVAQMLSFVARRPGMGEMMIGFFILFTCWVIHVFTKK